MKSGVRGDTAVWGRFHADRALSPQKSGKSCLARDLLWDSG